MDFFFFCRWLFFGSIGYLWAIVKCLVALWFEFSLVCDGCSAVEALLDEWMLTNFLVKVGTQRIPDTIGWYVAIDAFGYSSVKVCSFSFCLLSNVGFIYMGQCVETVSGPADFQFVEANILVNVVMFKWNFMLLICTLGTIISLLEFLHCGYLLGLFNYAVLKYVSLDALTSTLTVVQW